MITWVGQPSEPTGQYKIIYQDITITDQQGKEWYGRIGSKQGYQDNTSISVTVEEKQGQDGPYNYFRKYDPQYPDRAAPQQAQISQKGSFDATGKYQSTPSQAQEAPSQPAQSQKSPNKGKSTPDGEKEMRIVRGNALNAVMSATEIPADMVKNYLTSSVQWILTGRWEFRLTDKPDKPVESQQAGEDDIPF